MDTVPIYHFKILVPAAAAGRIFGKGGRTIAQLEKDSGAHVKMSEASESYPGTSERVCLISGPIKGILKINDFFMENFSSTSIKILVPNGTAGMIIGKGGSRIKQIREESKADIQISQKCTDLSLTERSITIAGKLENIKKACTMILSKIVEDAGTSSLTSSLTTSMLTQLTSPPNHHQQHSIVKSLTPDPLGCSTNITYASKVLSAAPSPSKAMAASVSSDMSSAQIVESINLVLRVSGYVMFPTLLIILCTCILNVGLFSVAQNQQQQDVGVKKYYLTDFFVIRKQEYPQETDTLASEQANAPEIVATEPKWPTELPARPGPRTSDKPLPTLTSPPPPPGPTQAPNDCTDSCAPESSEDLHNYVDNKLVSRSNHMAVWTALGMLALFVVAVVFPMLLYLFFTRINSTNDVIMTTQDLLKEGSPQYKEVPSVNSPPLAGNSIKTAVTVKDNSAAPLSDAFGIPLDEVSSSSSELKLRPSKGNRLMRRFHPPILQQIDLPLSLY